MFEMETIGEEYFVGWKILFCFCWFELISVGRNDDKNMVRHSEFNSET